MSLEFDLVAPRFDFAGCTPPCTRLQMHDGFIRRLEEAYDIYPFVLTSAYRSPEYERKHGRAGTSAHVQGKAVDISTPDSRTRYHVLVALMQAGFTRFGFGPRFIHVDDDPSPSRPERSIFFENLTEKK